ncbi:MAG: ferritin [Verrucomicrobiota bacterium]
MIHDQPAQLINAQVGHEFSAFYQYIALSTWFDAQALPECARYFARQAEEERQHALKMVQFLNDVDRTVSFSAIAEPAGEFSSPIEAIQLAYDQEVKVTDQIKAIYDAAAENNDRVTQNFMQWFLEEQVEEVASMDTLLVIAKRAGDDLFRLEEYISREGHPEDAAQ